MAVPPEVPSLTLEEIHQLVQGLWLTRWDEQLAREQAARRAGRPKSVREQELEDLKARDAEEYRTGLGLYFKLCYPTSLTTFLLFGVELPDVTNAKTLALFRAWNSGDPSYLHILRFIRITSEFPLEVQLTRLGKDEKAHCQADGVQENEEEMDQDDSDEVASLLRASSPE